MPHQLTAKQRLCMQPVRDIQWAADDLVIAATGDGPIRIVQIATDHKLVERGAPCLLLVLQHLQPSSRTSTLTPCARLPSTKRTSASSLQAVSLDDLRL